MLCVTIAKPHVETLLAEHQRLVDLGATLVEWRLDHLEESIDLASAIAHRPGPVIVTCRLPPDGGKWDRDEATRRLWLQTAIDAGAEYVDLELETARALPRSGATQRIVSLHDFQATPNDLAALAAELATGDADVIKIATMARRLRDGVRMLELIRSSTLPTVGLCMGELGTPTRILAKRFGAPFTYASATTAGAVAPGQIGFKQMLDLYRFEEQTPATAVYAVIGDPIGHSKSPLVHNRALAALGLDGVYVPFRVPPDELAEFVADGPRLGIRGVSVTIPHKEGVVPLLDAYEPAVEAAQACNTLVFNAGGLKGFNTDIAAATESLERSIGSAASIDSPLAGRRVLLLGAGGVARGIAFGLTGHGAQVTVACRDVTKAAEFQSRFGCQVVPWSERGEVRAEIVVNCTPIGMHPKIDATPFDADAWQFGMIAFDTIYNPARTRFILEAADHGCATVTGVDMFLRQAALQFQLFTGHEPPLAVMKAALAEGL